MLLDIADLHVHYGKIEAIGGISLSVEQGEIVTLIGANGAGKTTTLKTISGLRRPSAGTVQFDGQDITGVPGHQRVKLGLCQAPEGRGIFPGMTVLENLEMGAYVRSRRASNELDRVLTLFPRLAERRKQQGGTLSGGEQQMLAIGRALMAEPKLLLLDEPSMGLAPLIVAQIFKILREINDLGTTILLVEQNAVQALALSHRAYVLETGKIVASGPAAQLLDDPALRAAYLGAELGAAIDGENPVTDPAT
jgi:branched-chain amino acid transport system ATP-binding protein